MMDKYVSQLIQDINREMSKMPEPPSDLWDTVDINNECEVEDISYIEQYHNGAQNRLEDNVGIKKELLPPEKKLNDEQVEQLLKALENLLEYHNYEAAYPHENLTVRTKYHLLYTNWQEKQPKVSFGRVGIEFCDFNEEECPIPGFCSSCKDYEKECEEGANVDDMDGLDFDVDDLLPDINAIKAWHKENEEVDAEDDIPGIFMYCNQWCERCNFTSRCEVYKSIADDIELKYSPEEERMMDKEKEELFNAYDVTGKHELIVLAFDYYQAINNWLHENEDFFSSLASKLWNVSPANYKNFANYIDTIHYYRLTIIANARQAFDKTVIIDMGNSGQDEERRAIGKLLLVTIDETVEAFSFLLHKLKKHEDAILHFLKMLEQLKAGIKQEIPEAETFIRPGLDEE